MVHLAHNQTIRISDEQLSGLYRVVLNEVATNVTLLVRLDPPTDPVVRGRPKLAQKNSRTRKTPAPMCGKLLWFETSGLDELANRGELTHVELERENFKDSPADIARFENRKKIMSKFLEFDSLRKSIRENGSIAKLVNNAVNEHSVSTYLVYKCWSLLCRYGFSVQSLRPRFDRCGAPGMVRDCSDSGRKKAGRKTKREQLAKQTGQPAGTTQPGMNAMWRQLILITDKKIATPKPRFAKRNNKILEAFENRFQEDNGQFKATPLKQGEYPNKRQIRRVLEIEVPRLQRLLESTTKGHFARNLRGMTGRNWKGVSGPGHTWAIDSTTADMYLRSSINPAWIIGRPTVYILVDVWSTAIVGFYVCLRNPSWEMAKVSIFSAVADSILIGELWSYHPIISLNPSSGLPAVILSDRGEYLSFAAKETAFTLVDRMSYTPPYRPELKGLVEVQNRIKKDAQNWIPGAIDARKKEFELRKFNPETAIFNVRSYTEYLHNVFAEYNLTADRRKRLDTSMIAAGVVASPAGLWRWGHEVGIGISRHFPNAQLIEELLPSAQAVVSREGVRFQGLHYESKIVQDAQWTAEARNFGSWTVPAHYYPGSVSRIWVPNPIGSGMIEMTLMDQSNASGNETFEEVEDAFSYSKLTLADHEHDCTLVKMKSHHNAEALVEKSKTETSEALKANKKPKPSLSEARKMEIVGHANTIQIAVEKPENTGISEGDLAYIDIMRRLRDKKLSGGE